MSPDYSKMQQELESGTIDPSSFRHVDHIGVACEILGKLEFIDALARYARGLQAVTKKAGVPEKFNVTITVAFMALIAERMNSGPYTGFPDFIARNSDLQSSDLLDAWYDQSTLKSDAARTAFAMPRAAA